jgi:hypothetical protein
LEATDQAPQGSQKPSVEDRVAALFEPKGQSEAPQQDQQQADTQATETEQAAPEGQAAETETETALPEVEEVEYEGKQYKLPKELKEALLRQSDYTKKTQEVAEQRRTAETLMQQAKQAAELQQAMQKPLAKVYGLDEQIAQYEKVDWNALMAQDATEAQKHFMAFQQLKDQRQKALTEVQGLYSQQMQAAQKAHQARLEEGHKALARDIKGWNPDLGRKLGSFVQESYGFTTEEAASIYDPRTVKMMHDAYQWRQLQSSKPAIEKKAPVTGKTLKPQAGEARSAQEQEYAGIRRDIKSAQTSREKAQHIQRLLAHRLS